MFRQKRVGKDWKHFMLYKLRTMCSQGAEFGPACSLGDDKRITRVGRYLRKYKLDEIPQLFNLLKGDMSFVGPKSELAKFVEYFRDNY